MLREELSVSQTRFDNSIHFQKFKYLHPLAKNNKREFQIQWFLVEMPQHFK